MFLLVSGASAYCALRFLLPAFRFWLAACGFLLSACCFLFLASYCLLSAFCMLFLAACDLLNADCFLILASCLSLAALSFPIAAVWDFFASCLFLLVPGVSIRFSSCLTMFHHFHIFHHLPAVARFFICIVYNNLYDYSCFFNQCPPFIIFILVVCKLGEGLRPSPTPRLFKDLRCLP